MCYCCWCFCLVVVLAVGFVEPCRIFFFSTLFQPPPSKYRALSLNAISKKDGSVRNLEDGLEHLQSWYYPNYRMQYGSHEEWYRLYLTVVMKQKWYERRMAGFRSSLKVPLVLQ
jgi:hypothetical protein